MPRASTRPQSRNGSSAEPRSAAARSTQEPDVFLNVPDLHVGEIRLDVENLEAHLALQARLGNLLELRAGAHVAIAKVELEIKDVAAKAMLKVRLDNVLAILDRALTSVDRNPEILEGVIETVDDAVGPGGVLGSAIEGVSQSVRGLPRRRRRVRLTTKIATAAGALGGAALVARSNGGIEKTIKELTS
jgi:hypothetical protein